MESTGLFVQTKTQFMDDRDVLKSVSEWLHYPQIPKNHSFSTNLIMRHQLKELKDYLSAPHKVWSKNLFENLLEDKFVL